MKSNGKIIDQGLDALKAAFEDAQFLSAEAKEASERIQLGEHRRIGVPDNIIMEVYGSVTEGTNICLEFTSDEGKGYMCSIESYADLIKFMTGDLDGYAVRMT